MVTLVICSILMAVVSQNFAGLNRVVQRFIEGTTFREQYLIFLLKFEEDYHRSDYFAEEDLLNFDQLEFTYDTNGDGDRLDSGEKIAYRWNEQKNRIDRKSGNGSYQAFLDNVTAFTWNRTSLLPLCYQMNSSNAFSEVNKELVFCRGN